MRSKITVLAACLLLVAMAMAADNTARTVLVSPAAQVGAVRVEPIATDAVPQHMNLQGYLTDASGSPVNGNKSMTFRIWRGGSLIWTENQTVNVAQGLFSAVLGSTTLIPWSVFDPGTACEFELTVEGQALSPRTEITSVGYAYRSVKSDTASYALGVGDNNAWMRSGSDSVLYTIHNLGIARGGAANALYGTNRYSHVNFGVACTTGANGQNYSYATVGGGDHNTASGQQATVAGGAYNTASHVSATISGGAHNVANQIDATVGGGAYNTASGEQATVGGGSRDTASGIYSTVPGGYGNAARASYSLAAGRRAKAANGGSFVWADGTDADFTSTASNQFLVRAGGGVGINKNNPTQALDVGGKFRSQNVAAEASVTGADSTNSTNFVDMPGMTLTVTTGDCRLLIVFNAGVCYTTGSHGWVRVLIDGNDPGASSWGNTIVRMPSVSAGTHVVKVQWHVSDSDYWMFVSNTRTLAVVEF